jgi:general secretion pathway protein D
MAVNDRDMYGFNAGNGSSAMQTSDFNNNSAPLNSSARGLFVKVLENSVNGYFQALKQSNANYDLLSSPRIMVLNNQEAVLSTQQKLGYVVDNLVNTSAGSSTVRTIQFLEVGTILKITPRVGDDGMVLMEVYPEVSDGEISSTGIPQKRVTHTNSKILVKDGQTFIIGGLIYDKVTKTKNAVPILSALPLLGGLFQSEDTVKSKRDIVVMITPHIVDPQGQSKVTQIDSEREKHEEYRKVLEVQK